MAATALLSSPRAAMPATTSAAESSPSRVMSSPTTPSKNVRLNAAADLIRNLDAALSGMTAAATSAAEDAARARRNAKAAGEVARRYGGASYTRGGSGKKKKGGSANHDNLLERKRERRAAARMAAEARQRRENPMLPSPRRTPRSTRGGVGVFWSGGSPPVRPIAPASSFAGVDEKFVVQGRATRPAKEMKIVTEPENRDANVGNNNQAQKLFVESTPLGNTEVLFGRKPLTLDLDSIPAVKTEDSNASNFNEFEDAMDHYNYNDGGDEVNYNANVMDNHPPAEQKQPSQATEQEATEGAPPMAGYYTDRNSYYNQQQQQQQPHYQSDQRKNAECYNQNQYQNFNAQPQEQQWLQGQHQPTQPTMAPTLTIASPNADAQHDVPKPSPKHSIPPTPPRSQPTSTNRIEASHAEDVLTLSLELERVRSQLTSTTSQLSDASTQVGYLQAQNTHLESELSNVHSQFESTNERTSTQLATVQEQLEAERLQSKAAEEDAALALELAKEAQAAKDECEMWLSRSLEEIDLWRGRVGALEHQLKEQQEEHRQQLKEAASVEAQGANEPDEETKKSVRFQDDCPPSPVVSEDGGFEDDAVNAAPPVPPPSAPPVWSSPPVAKKIFGNQEGAPVNDATSPIVANDGISGINSGIFSPPTNSNPNSETPSKSDMIASGRVYLQRASPSPLKNGLSPHPRAQASDLLKKSAETRRLLRERLTPGYNGGGGVLHKPPMANAKMTRTSSDNALNEKCDTFASRQGAACKAIGRTIRESGARLKLGGKWWDSALLLTNGGGGGSPAIAPVIEGVAQLESMVKGYCGSVEGTIGQQQEKINELLAFCDHLEKEVMLDRE
mmetsp:Transcript_19918/g.37492  ORF Transcript_19918/g.37492 Transcript_19918/m.37492 type:complete len:846 (+) Transcript_19918:194-2731(+)|eukprot:CAMPEP_0201677808 /NCGR_PEP_ID=MMETSP0494-20130426/44865_1 /ASSEMBLY_ACC=CAM_ASM_000839 /TAXON_ID=420259 /ORGANISM="Thalassiosira gravida, Strain GMp14c1" /LENGTH=845 /DNA_ID=CAMNT_0048160837 /DNA_START=186 /DNA_END=2723 /DNA_ORIENTATION=+